MGWSLVGLAKPEPGACVEQGALVWNEWTSIDAGGSGMPAGETVGDYIQCKSCHGWDRLGMNGGYVHRTRTAERPNAGLGDSNNLSRDIAPGMGDYYHISNNEVLHTDIGRAFEDGSGSWVELGDAPSPAEIAAHEAGYTLGNQHPDFSITGANAGDVVLTQDQVDCVVAFVNFGDSDPKFYFENINTDKNPVEYTINAGARAEDGEAFYESSCQSCHGDPFTDHNGDNGGKPAGGMLAFLRGDGNYSEFVHKARWGIPGTIMTRAVMGAPDSQNMLDMMLYLQELNAASSFSVGGVVSDLAGSGMVLQNNAGDDLVIDANGGFSFPTALADGSDYSVTVKTQPTNLVQTCSVTNGSGTIEAADVTNISVSCSTDTFTIGGDVNGLEGNGLVLQNNAGDDLAIEANGGFTFPTALADGSAYVVMVSTQPSNPVQTCSVSSGSNTLAGTNVMDVSVTCSTDTYTVGGDVSGLEGSGLVLQNNAGDDLAIAGNGGFTFPTPLEDGSTFVVTIKTQPANLIQTCSISSGSGTLAGANVTNVQVSCSTDTFTIGGDVSGLEGSGLVLQNNDGDDLAIDVDSSFIFPMALADGSAYSVTVKTQPANLVQTCSVSSGSGALAGTDVTNVTVTCSTDTFTIGGNVSGLAGSGLVLQNNAVDDLAIDADSSFTFPVTLADGSAYAVTVKTQPSNPAQTCSVSNGNGTLSGSDVSNVLVSCYAFWINAGLNDAWYYPLTDGQGFFISVFPKIGKVTLSWFTYDTVRPGDDVTANLGEPGHRWLNALGDYFGDQAVLDITIASGGLFDTPTEITEVIDGTIILTFTDCENGTVEYDIPSIDRNGIVPIQRVVADNIELCKALKDVAVTQQSNITQKSDINDAVTSGIPVPVIETPLMDEMNPGLNDAWYYPDTDGQGFFITVFPVIEKVVLSWFTYDTVRPGDDVTANLGDPGHRWFNALGDYSGNQAVLDISIASGGLFDTPTEVTEINDGSILLTFTDCENGTVEYDIPSIDRSGIVPIQRVVADNIVLCEALLSQ